MLMDWNVSHDHGTNGPKLGTDALGGLARIQTRGEGKAGPRSVDAGKEIRDVGYIVAPMRPFHVIAIRVKEVNSFAVMRPRSHFVVRKVERDSLQQGHST